MFYDTMDKQALIEKIQTLGGLTNDEKSALLELLRAHKKYGLVWEDKPEDVEERLRDELPVLTEVKERALISDAPDAPNHILIEGDNLEALTALSYTHEGKVDVIYIDPPYNTGNKDFVYNDKFVDSEDDYRHSKWLSFMDRRLRIARRLLSDKGVIFISIDDNEQAQLKLLCDEVFGIGNFAANVIWEKADSPRMDAKDFTSKHDYLLVYCKNKDTEPIQKLKCNTVPEHYNKIDDKGRRYYLKPLRYMGNADSKEDRPNMYYPIIAPDGTEVLPKRADGSDGRWRWSKEKFSKEYDRLEFVKAKKGWSVYTRIFADADMIIPIETIWYNKDVESNRNAIATLKLVFGSEKVFTNPKPLKLIERCISISSTTNPVILDFFAGSGTTLHATMQLNAEDGGHRKCILVTNNENGICENVTYERNKRVIQGYTTPKGEKVPGLTANTLRYYKTDFISRDRTQRNMHALVEAATDLLCIKEDLYEEQTHFGQYKTHPKVLRYFAKSNKRMLVLYRDEYTEEVAAEIERIPLPQGEKIKVYIFSPDRYAYDDMFQDVAEKVTLVALPAAIYDAYKKVLPKRREKLLELQTDHNEANEEGGEQ